MKKKHLTLIAILLTVLICIISIALSFNNQETKLNILILSVCSLKKTHLSEYGYKRETMPKFKEFSQKSFIFDNAFNVISWSNIYLIIKHLRKTIAKYNYKFLTYHNRMLFHIINRHDVNYLWYDYKKSIEYFSHALNLNRNEPFIAELHFKIMHYPYLKFLKTEKNSALTLQKDYDRYMSPTTKKLFHQYSTNPKKYPQKKVLFGTIWTQKSIMEKVLGHRINKKLEDEQYASIIQNMEYQTEWKNSSNYELDLQLIKDIYDAKLHYFDEILNPLLDLFSNKKLKNNTVIIFLGDHGEAFMEHNYLTHGETVYDEVLTFPMFIKFPKQTSSIRIKKQMSQKSLKNIITEIMKGNLNHKNFENYIKKKIDDKFIVTSNCMKDIYGIRFDNKWKYIIDYRNQKRELYDLSKDHSEKHDIYNKILKETPLLITNLEDKIIDVILHQDNYFPFDLLSSCNRNILNTD